MKVHINTFRLLYANSRTKVTIQMSCYAHDILTRNWYQKLVPENLVPVSRTCVMQSGTSFCLVPRIEHVLFSARNW